MQRPVSQVRRPLHTAHIAPQSELGGTSPARAGAELEAAHCRPQRIYFTDCNRTLIVGSEDGFVRRYDVETGKCTLESQVHDGELTDLAMGSDGTHMASCSKDKTGKLLDVETLEVIHNYQHERPVNAIALNPIQEHVRPPLPDSPLSRLCCACCPTERMLSIRLHAVQQNVHR